MHHLHHLAVLSSLEELTIALRIPGYLELKAEPIQSLCPPASVDSSWCAHTVHRQLLVRPKGSYWRDSRNLIRQLHAIETRSSNPVHGAGPRQKKLGGGVV
jgi:hypothetical protein